LPDKSAPRATKAAPGVASANIRLIGTLERQALHDRTALDRLTDAITSTAGSPIFVIAHAAWFTVWIGLNVTGHRFDPFPFNLLTLIVSLEAIFLTGFVLMTQNRMTRQADRRAHLDLQVNMLAEQELTTMLKMLTGICQRLDVQVAARDGRVEQLLADTDIHKIAVALDRELAGAATEPSSAPAPHTPLRRHS